VNTRFHLRERVFGDLRSVGHSSRRPGGNRKAELDEEEALVAPGITAPDGPEPAAIDTFMFGEPEMMAAHLLDGERAAIVDPGPANTVRNLAASLKAMGVDRLDSIVLTHIHFDHAAGAAKLARHFPDATVYIHARVAEHLVDPARLIDGVKSVWGEKTEELFGLPDPIAADRVVPLADGDSIDLGDRRLEAIATPGHTRAHMSFVDSGTGAMLCGDAIGLQMPSSTVIRPSTPPSDFSYEDARRSIERLGQVGATSVHLPHFGETGSPPDRVFDEAERALSSWHETFLDNREAAESDLEVQRRFNACVDASLEPVTPVTRKGFEAVNPVWLNIAGMTAEAERGERGSKRPAA
jgi:glyoxylase-like metal-dependent hydrolase (beta-lactamase superfamily II)